MAAALNGNAALLHCAKCLYIDAGRCDQGLTQSSAQFIVIGIQGLLRHLEYLTNQGETVRMNTAGSNADEHVTGQDRIARDHVFTVYQAYGKTGQIVLILRHKPGMLCGLAADQSTIRLHAAVCYTLNDLRDLLGIVLSACDIIQEKQRLTAGARDVIYAHCDRIDTDGIMLVHQEAKLHLRSATVGSGQKNRIFHLLNLCHGECA